MSRFNLDRWAPEQKQAILVRGHNVLVSAGAGSGKTSVLVERVISYLLGNPTTDVDQLLIVTFTEAAAAEMRERIRNRLQKLLKEAKDDEDYPCVRQILRQFSLLDQAQISTLHSFCLDIVRRNFLYLDFDPNFGILSEQETVELREEIVRDMLEERLQDKDEAARARFDRMLTKFDAIDPQKLIPIVFRLDTFSDSQPNPVPWLNQVVSQFPDKPDMPLERLECAASFFDWMERLLDDARYGLNNAHQLATGMDGLESYLENIERMTDLLQNARTELLDTRSLSTGHAFIRALLSLKSPRAKSDAQNKDEVMDARKRVVEIIKLLDEIVGRTEQQLVSDLVAQRESVQELCEFVILFKTRVMEAKRQINKLYFSDLEHLAFSALSMERTSEQVRLKNRFAAILVDEYQDTSPIQDAIIRKIIRDDGNLFAVGDVKQSIYRFRMAEPKLFTKQYESLGVEEPGEVIDLAANYRSRREIVACVNFVFSKLFTISSSGFNYDDRAKMKSGAIYPPASSETEERYPVEFHLVERNVVNDDSVVSSDEENDTDDLAADTVDLSALEKEALVIGQRILELTGKAEGTQPQYVYDKSSEHYRPITFRDIVILLRSAEGRSRILVDMLQVMSIPATGIRTSSFYESLEVKWLIAALTAIHNPRRELELVTFLHSPLIGLTNEQLARIRTAGKGNFYDALMRVVRNRPMSVQGQEHESGHTFQFWRDESLIVELQSIWKMFDSWRSLARRASTGAVLRRMITDTGFIHYVAGMKGGEARKRNVQTLLDEARVFDRNSADGVFGFLSQIESVLNAGISVSGSAAGVDGEDAVRIMTIHGSKGLEFPVVFVADLGKQFGSNKGELQFGLHRDLGFGPVFYDESHHRKWRTVASIAISERERTESTAEEARILYVAMTRARERLIFIGSGRNLDRMFRLAAWTVARDGQILSKSSFLSAKSYLDWLIPAFLHHDECKMMWNQLTGGTSKSASEGDSTNQGFPVCTTVWNHPYGRPLPLNPLGSRVKPESIDANIQSEVQLIDRLLAETNGLDSEQLRVEIVEQSAVQKVIPSKVSATELRRLWVAASVESPGHGRNHVASATKLLSDPTLTTNESISPSPLRAGTAFHKLMQCIDLHVEPTVNGVQEQMDKLKSAGKLTSEDITCIVVEDVVQWLESPLFARVRSAEVVYREQPFFHRITLPSSRYVIAQGIIDCLAKESTGWLIVDYKTDNIDTNAVNEQSKEYEAQVGAYIAAIHSIVESDSVEAYLYFVGPRATVRVKPMDMTRVFTV